MARPTNKSPRCEHIATGAFLQSILVNYFSSTILRDSENVPDTIL